MPPAASIAGSAKRAQAAAESSSRTASPTASGAKPAKGTAAAAALAPSAPNLFVGTSGWAYPSWKPGFYPKDIPARAFLQHYAGTLTAVEVNYTFRDLPTAEQVAAWLTAVPPGFRFGFKAPQRITHFARLRDCAPLVTAFLQAIEPVRKARKLAPLLIQLPPNFKLTPETLGRLEEFLALPAWGARRPQLAFEFRHESWFAPEVYKLLKQHRAALCIAETDDLTTPDVQTARFSYYRLRRHGGYGAAELATMAERFREQAARGEVYAFFRHQEEPTGALNAVALQRHAAGAA